MTDLTQRARDVAAGRTLPRHKHIWFVNLSGRDTRFRHTAAAQLPYCINQGAGLVVRGCVIQHQRALPGPQWEGSKDGNPRAVRIIPDYAQHHSASPASRNTTPHLYAPLA